MHFYRTNGAVAHFADEGPRRAPALVFINSLGTDLRIWDEVSAPLSRARRVIRYDKRGHGLSELGGAGAAIADFARDLAGLLDALESGAATIVGLSIGGLIAQELYRLRPDLVASLILCDTGCKIGTAAMWDARIGAIEAGGIASIADAVMERWFTPAYRANNRDALAGWRMMLARTPQEGYLAACRAIREADLTEAARRIGVKTLCVVGDDDLSTPPALAREMAALIPGARLEIVAGAGHLPCIEQPDALRRLIETHLKEASL